MFGHLVPACTPGSVLHDPAQIGIKAAVKQPGGVGSRLSAPKDVVIWPAANGNCWSPDMLPVNAPLAVLEWKCYRPGKAKQNPDGGVLRRLSMARRRGGAWEDEWLVLPAGET